MTVSDSQIENLRSAAGQAGDLKQVKICDRALSGSKAARRACATVIAYAEGERKAREQRWAAD